VAGALSPRGIYVLTKIAVFAVAAALTWPLAKMIGPKAWWGLGVFGAILVVLTAVVFAAFGRQQGSVVDQPVDDGDDDAEPFPEDAVELEIGDSIDLHSFPPKEIPEVVADYLAEAHAKGFREVRIIHGRGIGVQRERVRSLLSKHPLVEGHHDAPPERGGWGATIAYLSPVDR
jgi:hypothetical protein